MDFFKEQVGVPFLFSDLLYVIAALAVLLIVAGLGVVDMSLVRRKNVLDTWVQKLAAATIAGFATLLGGYAIWQWQFNVAFDIPNPLSQAIKDWWIGGQYMTTFSQHVDPKVLPEADVQQIFVVFFATFSMATIALIHSGTIERMRPMPLYVMSFVIGLVLSPAAGLLGWGPVGPLTNHGTHDFEGVFPLYIFAGTWVLVLAWRLGPRLGAFDNDARGVKPTGHNVGLAGLGVLMILFAIPLVVLGSTWVIPDVGVFGISFTETGVGILILNTLMALCVGGVVGAIIAYRLKQPVWVLLGPIAGIVFCGTMADVAKPWHIMLLAGFGPLVSLLTARLLVRLRIDEPKVVPLALGPGIVGALVCGFVYWGTKTGGFPGLKGDYALGHAEITPWWQLAGIVAVVALSAIPCLLFCLFFERRGKLRVTEDEEIAGLDQTYWGISNFGTEPHEEIVESSNGSDEAAARIATPAP